MTPLRGVAALPVPTLCHLMIIDSDVFIAGKHEILVSIRSAGDGATTAYRRIVLDLAAVRAGASRALGRARFAPPSFVSFSAPSRDRDPLLRHYCWRQRRPLRQRLLYAAIASLRPRSRRSTRAATASRTPPPSSSRLRADLLGRPRHPAAQAPATSSCCSSSPGCALERRRMGGWLLGTSSALFCGHGWLGCRTRQRCWGILGGNPGCARGADLWLSDESHATPL